MKRSVPARVAGALVRAITLCAGCALVAGGLSCAKVTVRKVPAATQYQSWDDTKQAKADAMEGLRFYLPRPFVSVFESFPIGTDIYIAHGTVSADGEYVYINSVTPLTTRVDVTRPNSAAEVVMFPPVPTGAIILPKSGTTPGGSGPSNGTAALRSGTGDATGGEKGTGTSAALDERLAALERLVAEGRIDAATASKSAKDAIEAARESKDASAAAADSAISAKESKEGSGNPETAVTGRNSRTMTNSNGAFAYTPLRGNLDIVYLPDFDEQYVVSSQANLGNASFMMNMGQGWSLQGFNSISDNSELNKRIFALIDKASELASLAADAGMTALFPPAGAAIAADRLASLRSATNSEVKALPAGTPVTLRIVVVHYAAKGLYPVIKPRELKEAGASRLFLDLYASRNAAGNVVGYNAAAIDRAIDHYDQLQRRFTVPVYPYQYISFNTFRYVSIEALTPAGTGYGDLYDKTGTAGDPGDRQAADLADLLRELLKQNFGTVVTKPDTKPPEPSMETVRRQLQTELNNEDRWSELTKTLNTALGLTGDAVIKVLGFEVKLPSVTAQEGAPQKFEVIAITDKEIPADSLVKAKEAIAKAIIELITPPEGVEPGDVAKTITKLDQLVVAFKKKA